MLSADSQDSGSLFLLDINILTSLHMVFICNDYGVFEDGRVFKLILLENTCNIMFFIFIITFYIYTLCLLNCASICYFLISLNDEVLGLWSN